MFDEWRIFQLAMFDYQRVSYGNEWICLRMVSDDLTYPIYPGHIDYLSSGVEILIAMDMFFVSYIDDTQFFLENN